MLAVFEHLDPTKLVSVLKETRRVLKPEGRLIITIPCAWTDKLLRTMAKLNLVSLKEIKEHKKTYNHSEIASQLLKADFRKTKMKHGYFECFMNNWLVVEK